MFLLTCFCCSLFLLSQIDYNPFCSLRDYLYVRGQTERQREKGDAGCVSKVLCPEKGSRYCGGEALAASELETVPILRKENGEGKCGENMRSVEGAEFNDKGKLYLLARNVGKGAPPEKYRDRARSLDSIGLGEYLDVDRFGVLPVKGDNFRITTMGLMKLTSYGTFILQQECNWRLV